MCDTDEGCVDVKTLKGHRKSFIEVECSNTERLDRRLRAFEESNDDRQSVESTPKTLVEVEENRPLILRSH